MNIPDPQGSLAHPGKNGDNTPLGEIIDYAITLIDQGSATGENRVTLKNSAKLTDKQLERAYGLGFPQERIHALEHVISLGLFTLRGITNQDGEFQSAKEYLNTIVGAFVDHSIFNISAENIPKNEIHHLINHIFSEENMQYGISYIMAYFAPFIDASLGKQVINIRLLTGLLDFWRQLGKDHDLFGRIPTAYQKNLDVFECYTAYRENGRWYCTVPFIDEKNILYSKDYTIPIDASIPDTFARIGMHGGSDMDIELDVGHYETIYVLGGDIYKHLRPADKGLRGFIRKHYAFLSQEGNAPWKNLGSGQEGAWQGAKKLLENITNASNSTPTPLNGKTAKKPKQKQQRTPLTTSSHIPHAPNKEMLAIKYEKPAIKGTVLEEKLWSNTNFSILASSLCSNYPPDTILCVGEYEITGGSGQKSLVWHGTGYSPSDDINFHSSPRKKREFVFCFVAQQSNNIQPSKGLTRTELVFERPKAIKDISKDTPQAVHRTLTDSRQGGMSRSIETGKNTESDSVVPVRKESPTERLGLQILELLDTITISRTSPNVLSLSLGKSSNLEYNIKRDEFCIRPVLEGVDTAELMSIVGSDLRTKTAYFLEHELSSALNDILRVEESISRVLLSQFPNFCSRDEILAECRQNGYFTGSVLLGHKFKNHLQDLQVTFDNVGLAISIERVEKEMNLTITLRNLGKRYLVSSLPGAPFVAVQNEHFITNGERQMLMNMFLLLGMLGRSLANPSEEPARKSTQTKRTTSQILSDADILHIIQGTYKPRTLSVHDLSREQQDMLVSAIKRLYEKQGRKLCSEGFHADTGYYSCIIEGHKGWSDLSDGELVILVDEKISIAPKGKKGHLHIYDIVDKNPRLQKYLVLKMIATITEKSFRGKRPFTNGMRDCFMSLWNTIPTSDQKDFLKAVAGEYGRTGNALNFETTDGTNILQAFLDKLRNENVPLIYSRPHTVSVNILQAFQQQINSGDLNLREYCDED